MLPEFPNISKLQEELSRLQEGVDLLKEIYTSAWKPYTNTLELSNETLTKLRAYFKFDDSE